MNDKELYTKIYVKNAPNLTAICQNYIQDKDEAYQIGMVFLMYSLKMLMFSGVEKEDLPNLYNNIEKTWESVYQDFGRVDINLKD
jgi:hypothetical protein